MGQANTLKKLRKYARHESRKHFDTLKFENALLMLLKPKPKWIPKWLWKKLIRFIIKDPSKHDQGRQNIADHQEA